MTTFSDDAIVVIRVKKGVGSMSAVRALRDKLGDDAMAGLHIVVSDAGRQWKEEVLTIAGERFDKRLTEEIGALRVDMAKEFGAVRLDTAQESATVRVDMAALRADMARESAVVRKEMSVGLADTRAELLKWSFLFWIGQFAAVSAMMAFLLRTIGPR